MADKYKDLLEEIVYRTQIAFPVTENQLRWFDEGYHLPGSGDLFVRMFDALDMDIDKELAELAMEFHGKPTKNEQLSKMIITKEELTVLEVQIIQKIWEGKNNTEISDEMKIKPRTIEGIRYRLLKRLNVKNVAGLLKFALKQGVIRVDLQ